MSKSISSAFANQAAEIIREQVDEILEYRDQLFNEDNIEAIHQSRVGVNKLRVALKFFHSAAPKKLAATLSDELSWYKDGLAAVRDSDVTLELMRKELGDPPYAQDFAGIEAIVQALQNERAGHLQELRDLCNAPRFDNMMNELGQLRKKVRGRAANADAEDPEVLQRNLRDLLEPLHARFEKQRQKLVDSFEPLAMHRWRIAAKKFRYALDFFEEFRPELYPELSKVLHDLHDCTGELHDMDVLGPKVETLSAHWKMTKPPEEMAQLETGIEWVLFRLYVRRRELMRQFYGIWATLASDKFQEQVQEAISAD